MKKPQSFSKPLGVLNIGMVFVSGIFISFGAVGYWKYGEDTAASLTLNLPIEEMWDENYFFRGQKFLFFSLHSPAQVVKMAIATGVLLGYAIQFFVAIQIMFPNVQNMSKFTRKHPVFGELIFRTFMVLITFLIAILIPELDLLLSLIGAVCSTVLALVLPPIMEIIIESCEEKRSNLLVTIKNVVILFISLLGFLTGGYESLSAILSKF